MGLFGKLDAANIKTNPYFIAEGEYPVEVVEGKYNTNRDGKRQLMIKFKIDDPDSAYNEKPATKFFDLPDETMTEEEFEILPPDEKKQILQDAAAVKRWLCGNAANRNQHGLGVNEEDLNDPNWDPAVLVGIKATLSISNYGDTNEGVNLRWVNLRIE